MAGHKVKGTAHESFVVDDQSRPTEVEEEPGKLFRHVYPPLGVFFGLAGVQSEPKINVMHVPG
jgi:hypothetical protein